MVQQFIDLIMSVFGNLFGVFILSMSPILELRGSIPVGYALGRYAWWQVYLAAVLGNTIVIPFAVFFLRKIFRLMRKIKIFSRLIDRIENKAQRNADKIKNGIKIGLYFFVAIPLPGTGAWTGSLVASFLDMKLRDCFWPIFLGVLTAGAITTIVVYGGLGILRSIF